MGEQKLAATQGCIPPPSSACSRFFNQYLLLHLQSCSCCFRNAVHMSVSLIGGEADDLSGKPRSTFLLCFSVPRNAEEANETLCVKLTYLIMGIFLLSRFHINVIFVDLQAQVKRKPWDWIPDEILTLNSNLLPKPGILQFAF